MIAIRHMKPSTAPARICHRPAAQASSSAKKTRMPRAAGVVAGDLQPGQPRDEVGQCQCRCDRGAGEHDSWPFAGRVGASVARISALRASERLSRGGGRCDGSGRPRGAVADRACGCSGPAGTVGSGAAAGPADCGRSAWRGLPAALATTPRQRRPLARWRRSRLAACAPCASGSSPSVIARTTAIRCAPARRIATTVRRVDTADRKERMDGVRRRLAHERGADGRPAGLGRRRVDGPDADVVDVAVVGGGDLRWRVRRQPDDPLGSDDLPRLRHSAVILADVDAVSVRVGDELWAIVEDEQGVMGGAQRRVAPPGGDEGGVVSVLVAQLHDVDAAPQRGVDQRVIANVAYEVQAGVVQPLAAGVHRSSLAGVRG